MEFIGIIFIILGLDILLLLKVVVFKNENKPIIKRDKFKNACILIPARDESSVIEDLLISIKDQTREIKMEDVIIILEDSNDPTIEIAKKYKATAFVRVNTNLKSSFR